MAILVAILTIVLRLPRKAQDLVTRALNVVECMTGNAYFTTPTPPLATVSTAITALSAAISNATNRAPGAAQARKDRQAELIQILKHLADYVKGIAESQPAIALTIVRSASMYLLGHTLAPKPDLAAYQGISGVTVLRARAGKPRPSVHYWQMSADGKTWTSVPETDKATTTISGLTPGQTYTFRHASMRKGIKSDWSQEITFLAK